MESPLTGHELLGVLSSRLVHSLSNFATAVSGNLLVCNSTQATAQQKLAALESLNIAARRSGELLDRFSDLCRSIRAEAPPCPLPDLLSQLREWSAGRWEIQIASTLAPQTSLALGGPWKWVQFSLEAIAEKIGKATIRIEPAPTPRDVRPFSGGIPSAYISILITGAAINWHEQREHLRDWNLTAAYELLNQLGGRPQTVETPAGTHQTQIVLPLIDYL